MASGKISRARRDQDIQNREEPRQGRAGSVPRQQLRAAPGEALTLIRESLAVLQGPMPILAVPGSAGRADADSAGRCGGG